MRKTFILGAMAFTALQVNAQVQDVSVTLQPTASYNWFDDDTAIEDGVMIGGRVGFGFGEALEIRGVYEKSIDLQNTVDGIDFIDEDDFESRDVDVERYGGEFKANIPTRGTFAPYITLGAGVQKLTADLLNDQNESVEIESEQIYGQVGVGTMLRLGDRLNLSLEAKNTVFNMNPANVLFTPDGDPSDFDDREDRMYNWSAMAGLQIYLGGREPGSMSDLDRAYYRKFSGGLGGFKLSLEPVGGYISFDGDTNLSDTYLIGGQAGFDFNQYVGIRGYYMQATKDEKISTDFDDLAIYGGDIIAKLNVARGLVPYLSIGGGYMNVYDSYIGEDDLTGEQSGYFAKGGLGLNVPVTKNLELFGAANLMFTSSRDTDDLENIISPDELRQHTMYNVGVRFQLGKGANEDEIIEDRISKRVDERTDAYQDRIDELEAELAEAYDNNDTDKAVQIIEEKKELEGKKAEATSRNTTETGESRVRMTPEELESLVEKVIKGVDEEENTQETSEERIDRLERLLLEVNTQSYYNGAPVFNATQQDLASERIMDKLDQLNDKIDDNSDRINRLNNNDNNNDKTVVVTGGTTQPSVVTPNTVTTVPTTGTTNNLTSDTVVTTDKDGNIVQKNNDDQGVATGLFVNEGMSIFGGFAFGDDSAGIVGIRGHYSITNSGIEFMPDLYVAPGENTGFGINANALYSFDTVSNDFVLSPYIGLGLGYNSIGDFDEFGTNLIIGTSLNVLGGNLYADYTARGFIDISQISVGYKFGF